MKTYKTVEGYASYGIKLHYQGGGTTAILKCGSDGMIPCDHDFLQGRIEWVEILRAEDK